MPRGRLPGSRNKPKDLDQSKPRKPYVSSKRRECPPKAKEDLLARLKKEVSSCALAIVPCDRFDRWLATFAQQEGNHYVRYEQHQHTYNSTHHRVVTYRCNSMHEADRQPEDNEGERMDSAGKCNTTPELVRCDAILDIYYFYDSNVYQVVRLGEHYHEPAIEPLQVFEAPLLPEMGASFNDSGFGT